MARTLAWFSCGDASAAMTRLLMAWRTPDLTIVREVIESEHPDNNRFSADCSKWYGSNSVRSGRRRIVQLH